MAARPSWQGHLKLSLVTCPVALYPGTSSSSGVSFNLLNPATGNRINMVPTDPETGPVLRSDLVKGYPIDKHLYVTVTNEELDAVKIESSRTIDVEQFVPVGEIDRLYWDAPYFLAPDGKLALEAYSVIREAMRQEGQVAIGRVTLSSKERLMALEPRGKGIVAHTLRTAEEVRDCEEVFRQIEDAAVDPAMVAIAKQIVAQRAAAFDPSQFRDRYADAVRALIETKRAGAKPTISRAPDEHQVINLMDALRRSLAGEPPEPNRATAAKAKRKAAEKVAEEPRTIPARRRRDPAAPASH